MVLVAVLGVDRVRRHDSREDEDVEEAPTLTDAKDFDLDQFDLIISDLRLPGGHGTELIELAENTPVLIMTSYASLKSAVDAMKLGAVDYIAKPFNPELLLARVRAVLSRARRSSSLIYRRRIQTFHFGGWVYDGKQDEVRSPDGYQVTLSRRETALLKVLLANPHIPLTRQEIATALDVTGDQDQPEATGRAIDVLVGRLRSKIETDPKAPDMIRTERGTGYVFAVDVTAEPD